MNSHNRNRRVYRPANLYRRRTNWLNVALGVAGFALFLVITAMTFAVLYQANCGGMLHNACQ